MSETSNNAIAEKMPGPMVLLQQQLEARSEQFHAALPAHIPVERFKRVILTAVQHNPDLVTADRPTFFTSAMKAAQDGLLPDGREGALVIFRTKIKGKDGKEFWVNAVQWLPMIAGLRKKVRNSKEIATWDAHIVHEKDEFDYQLGDDPFIHHKPYMGSGEPGKIIAAYSIAVLKTGEKSREVMTVSQIEKVRAISKAPEGPAWKGHYGEMCRKTVARRHSKVLPMSTDLDDLMRRDDELYDIAGASDKVQALPPPKRPQYSDFMQGGDVPEQGRREPVDDDAPQPPSASSAGDEDKPANPMPPFGSKEAYELGAKARKENRPLLAYPADLSQDLQEDYKRGWRNMDVTLMAGEGPSATG